MACGSWVAPQDGQGTLSADMFHLLFNFGVIGRAKIPRAEFRVIDNPPLLMDVGFYAFYG
jgi:hypothetical protein